MEEFYYSGGLPAVIRRMGEANLLPHPQALTVNGQTIWENCQQSPIYNDEVIRKIDNPIRQDGGMCILRGNLAPKGAVLKPSAATPELMKHRGRAVVFENFDDYKARINDPDLDVDETCILVMKMLGLKATRAWPRLEIWGYHQNFSQRHYRHGSYFRRTNEWNSVWHGRFTCCP